MSFVILSIVVIGGIGIVFLLIEWIGFRDKDLDDSSDDIPSWEFEFLGVGILNNSSIDIIDMLEEKGFTKTGDLTLEGTYCESHCKVTIELYKNLVHELIIEFKDPFRLSNYWEIEEAYKLKYEKLPDFNKHYLIYTSYYNYHSPIHVYFKDLNKIILANENIYKQIREDKKVALSQKYVL